MPCYRFVLAICQLKKMFYYLLIAKKNPPSRRRPEECGVKYCVIEALIDLI